MKRTHQLHTRQPQIGLFGQIFVGVLALPFGIGAALGALRGDWLNAALFTGMFLVAGYAAWTGIHLWARHQAPRAGGLPREAVPRKARGARNGSP